MAAFLKKLLSRPTRPAPLFRAFVEAALQRAEGRKPHLFDLDTPVEQRYERALGLLGIDPRMLSQEAGHA